MIANCRKLENCDVGLASSGISLHHLMKISQLVAQFSTEIRRFKINIFSDLWQHLGSSLWPIHCKVYPIWLLMVHVILWLKVALNKWELYVLDTFVMKHYADPWSQEDNCGHFMNTEGRNIIFLYKLHFSLQFPNL